MSCRFKFGLIVAPTDGAVVRIKPETKAEVGKALVRVAPELQNVL